jgi:hypothetical protein
MGERLQGRSKQTQRGGKKMKDKTRPSWKMVSKAVKDTFKRADPKGSKNIPVELYDQCCEVLMNGDCLFIWKNGHPDDTAES